MTFNIISLLILFIPGFWSVWAYKHITLENLDKRESWTLLSLGICFGITNLFLLNIIIPSFFYCVTRNCEETTLLAIARAIFTVDHAYIDKILSDLSGKNGDASFLLSYKFFYYYLKLGIVALVNGLICGVLQGKNWLPTQLMHRLGAFMLSRDSVQVNCESALRNQMYKISLKTIVRISKIEDTSIDRSIMGYYSGFSETEKQINLKDIDLFKNLRGIEKEYVDSLPIFSTVELESGIVIEFFLEEKENAKKLKNHLIRLRNIDGENF